MTDVVLFERWAERRDPQAFKELVKRYAPMVFATCSRVLGNSADAEEVTQDCFELLARAEKTPTVHVGAWLHRVATNRALDRVRSEQSRKTREANFAARQPDRREPEWNDVYDYVDEAIADLPEELRIPVVAYYLLDTPQKEIAAGVGVTRRSVSRRITRGVELIGKALRRRGIAVTTGVLTGLLATHLAEAATLPAPLTAALGKLALAQSANAIGVSAAASAASTAGAAKLIGGVLVMKKTAAGLVLVVAALLGLWAVTGREPSANVEKTSEGVVRPQQVVEPTETIAAEASQAPAEEVSVAEEAAESQLAAPLPSVRGRVVDADTGEGVAGATVAAVAGGSGEEGTWESVTDQDGRFNMAELRPGNFLVFKRIGPDDYMVTLPDDMVEVCLRDGEHKEGVQLPARKGGTVSGKVTDRNGNPIAGAKLTVYPARNESFQGTRASVSWENHPTESDAAGEYVFRGLKLDRSCVVLAGADGYTYARSSEFLLDAGGMNRRIDFKLSRGSAISGWVQNRKGRRLPDEPIALEAVYEKVSYAEDVLKIFAQGRTEGARSDDEGRFRFEGLPAGTYHILAGGLHSTMRRFDGGGTRVDLDGTNSVDDVVVMPNYLEQGDHFLAGRVVDSKGAGIADAEVCVAPKDIRGIYCLPTDEQGAFVVEGLPGDVSLLSVTAAGYTQEVLDSVPVDGPDLVIVLEGNAPIRGRVLDSDNGKPVPGASVAIARHERRDEAQQRFGYLTDITEFLRRAVIGAGTERATTGRNGEFELASVNPGRVKLKAECAGYAVGLTNEFAVTSGQAVEGVTLRLDRGASIEGIVRATNGAAVAGASIMVIEGARDVETPRDSQLRLLRATNAGQGGPDILSVSGADGYFVAEGVADGVYWLRALVTGYACSPVVEVDIRNGTSQSGLELVLEPGGTVEGYVTQGWAPKADILVQVHRWGPDAASAQIYTNEEGYYAIPHLATGEWELHFVDLARKGNTGVKNFKAEIVSGEITRQDVEYSGSVVSGMVMGLDEPSAWQVAVLALPDGVDPEAPPDPAIDWPSLVVSMARIARDGNYAMGDVPDGVYKLSVFRILADRIVAKNVWQTIVVAGEDLGVDLVAAEDLPMEIPVSE